ncbi:hypothetical protein NFI96_013942 [Prochilodus magdalenae]|nr:hypothetical protein NFI96_013942 [Prochilodus magdalenae]
MSNVRLSNGSPTLERMDARPSDQPKPSACRSLFGPVDHEELKRELKGHLRAMEEASTETWNFDFARFTPLSHGRYMWTAVDTTDLPSFYSSTGNKSVDVNGNHERLLAERSESQTERREQHVKGQRKRPSCLGTGQMVTSAFVVNHYIWRFRIIFNWDQLFTCSRSGTRGCARE